ncbi:MAG TPA: alpha/beta fold hydrolase [Gaiellaceae bacterium]|nr:alpha/beta fold hydrolase [Gaiellaceae bacterium]
MEELRVQGLAVSYTPAGATALVAIHGAGAGTRDSSPLYRHLHETLPAIGVGVATFDRRGEGDSPGEPTRGRFEAQARDALALAEALGVERVGLWGFSQGGWVAPLAATLSEDVAFVITIAATGVTPAEQMVYANRRALELAGYGPDAVERVTGLRRAIEAWAHDAGPPPDLAAAAGEPWFPLTYLPPARPEDFDDDAKRSWIAEMDFDPVPVFAAVRVPVLAFLGERDSVSPVEPSIAAWPQDDATVVVVPDAEHDLSLPDGTLAPLYEQTLVDWLS